MYCCGILRRVLSKLSTLEAVALNMRRVSTCYQGPRRNLSSSLVYTYIQSRFYRSPEVILGMNYHMAIDMWSLGCIMAELYTGFPIFPGENEQEQLSCIMEVLGVPEKDFINRSSRKRLFFGESLRGSSVYRVLIIYRYHGCSPSRRQFQGSSKTTRLEDISASLEVR